MGGWNRRKSTRDFFRAKPPIFYVFVFRTSSGILVGFPFFLLIRRAPPSFNKHHRRRNFFNSDNSHVVINNRFVRDVVHSAFRWNFHGRRLLGEKNRIFFFFNILRFRRFSFAIRPTNYLGELRFRPRTFRTIFDGWRIIVAVPQRSDRIFVRKSKPNRRVLDVSTA